MENERPSRRWVGVDFFWIVPRFRIGTCLGGELELGATCRFSCAFQPAFVTNSYPRILPRMFVSSILVEKPQDGVRIQMALLIY